MTEPLYSAQLDLRGRLCVVVGGGAVASRKVAALAQCGAHVRVIAPAVDDAIRALPGVEIQEREFRPGDLANAWLAVAATDDPAVNTRVAHEAETSEVWVNVADRSAPSSFVVPAVVRRGAISIAVSSGGASPALSARIRDIVAEAVDPAYADFAEWIAGQRARVQGAVPDAAARARILRRTADDSVFRCFSQQGPAAADAMVDEWIADAE